MATNRAGVSATQPGDVTPSNPPQGNNDGGTTTDQADSPRVVNSPLANKANPTGDPAANTGPVGDREVIDAQEHVLGDDPRRVAASQGGYHDSLSGRPVDADGYVKDNVGEGPIPEHRIVANDWPGNRPGASADDIKADREKRLDADA